jgi:hypothetical protein
MEYVRLCRADLVTLAYFELGLNAFDAALR